MTAVVVTLAHHRRLMVRQRRELAELFGFETRNRYEVVSEAGAPVAYAAEQQKGFLGFLFRQSLGHWRTFEIRFFTPDRMPFMTARHPFRWFFQRLEVHDEGGGFVGAIQQRFSILTKRFDVQDASGKVVPRRRRARRIRAPPDPGRRHLHRPAVLREQGLVERRAAQHRQRLTGAAGQQRGNRAAHRCCLARSARY